MRKYAGIALALSVVAFATVSVRQITAQTTPTPVSLVRRAEAAMIILKNAGVAVDIDADTKGIYPDILDGQWYVPYMVKALELGMIEQEKETGLIYPHKPLSRAEFLRMMTKAFGLTTNLPHEFTDIEPGVWYEPYVGLAWRYKLFVSEGTPNELGPELGMTPGHATEAIFSFLQQEPTLQPKANMFPVRKTIAETSKKLIESFINTIVPSTTEPETETETPKPKPVPYDPLSVKSTIIKLIRSRSNQAEFTRNELIDEVNHVRAIYNLGPVTSNYSLETSAQRHAKDMYSRGYFSHYTPEGVSYVERIRAAGYMQSNGESCLCAVKPCSCEPAFSVGENIAKGQLSVTQVMEDWMNSPSHRKNMLQPEFKEIGIGLFGDLWVQNFGKIEFK